MHALAFFFKTAILAVLPTFYFFEDISPISLDFKTRIPHLHSLLPVCNGFLRVTSGATPAVLLAASMVAELFRPTHLWRVCESYNYSELVNPIPKVTLLDFHVRCGT